MSLQPWIAEDLHRANAQPEPEPDTGDEQVLTVGLLHQTAAALLAPNHPGLPGYESLDAGPDLPADIGPQWTDPNDEITDAEWGGER